MSALFHSYLCGRLAAEWTIKMSDRGNEIRQVPGGAEFTQPGKGVLRVVFTREDILHIKYCFSEQASAHASYAVIRSPEENVNPAMAREAERCPLPAVELRQEEGAVRLCSAALEAQVELDPLAVQVKDRQGRALHRDVAGRSYTRDANLRSTHCFELGDYTAFYGFGEKTGRLNKYGRRMRMYSCDTMGYNSETTDPLYKHIPFFIKKDAGRGLCCGVFYDCPRQGVMDMGCERSGYWPRYGLVSFDGGDLDYYVIAGPEMKQVVRGYTWLTGTTALPTALRWGI